MDLFDDFLSSLLQPTEEGEEVEEPPSPNANEPKDSSEITNQPSEPGDNDKDFKTTASDSAAHTAGVQATDPTEEESSAPASAENPTVSAESPASEQPSPPVCDTNDAKTEKIAEAEVKVKIIETIREDGPFERALKGDLGDKVKTEPGDKGQQQIKQSKDKTGNEADDDLQDKKSDDASKHSKRDMPLCFKNTLDEEYVQNRKKFGLKICSVICFDVLKLGDRVFHRHDSSSAIFPTMKRVVVSKQNIRDMYKLEATKRQYYRKKLNRILRKERGSTSTKRKGHEDKKTGSQHKDTHKHSSHNEHKKKGGHHDVKREEKFSAGGTRILPFEKKYQEHNQQIKRPKLREESPPKISRVLTGKDAIQKKEKIKLAKPVPSSFKIPKKDQKETNDYSRYRSQPTAPTPLYTPRADNARFRPPAFQTYRHNTPNFNNPSSSYPRRPRWADDNLKTQWQGKAGNRVSAMMGRTGGFGGFGGFGVDNDSSGDGLSADEGSTKTPPPPISEVEFGPLVEGVTKLLENNSYELEHPPKDISSDSLAHKCAWWFKTMDKDPDPTLTEVDCPELHDHILQPSGFSDDEISFLGNISNPGDEDDDCQINEISSSTENLDPAITDEFCGSALLHAEYRVLAEKDDANQEAFKHIFSVPQGINYEKENFKVHCNICGGVEIPGNKFLGPHIRSSRHTENLKNLSLKIMSTVEKRGPLVLSSSDSGKGRSSPTPKCPKHQAKELNKSKDQIEPHVVKNSVIRSSDKKKPSRRSRSRSPRRKESRRSPKHEYSSRKRRSSSRDPFTNRPSRRSRSPHKRRRSRSRSRSPNKPKLFSKRKDNEVFIEKMRLMASGHWDADMERRWLLMEKEEEMVQKKFDSRLKQLEETPESHPSYATEWTKFWQNKYQEVVNLGQDADAYDFVPEWKVFWSTRGPLLLEKEYNTEIADLKGRLNMEVSFLRTIGNPVVAQQPQHPETLIHPQSNFVQMTPDYSDALLNPLTNTNNVHANRPSNQEDFTARSMSISDGGMEEHSSAKDVNPLTLSDFKSNWETLTGQRITDEKAAKKSTWSNSGTSESTSSSKYEFDGFDLVQVLQLMSNLEDKLGILAPEVHEFYKKAEEMELSKRRKSYGLLEKKDFVSLLLQCKELFADLMNSDSEVPSQTLNMCIHLVDLILATPTCTKVASLCNVLQMERQKRMRAIRRMAAARPAESSGSAEKRAIAQLLAWNFTSLGKNTCSEQELESMVYKVLHSIQKENMAKLNDSTAANDHIQSQSQVTFDTQYDSSGMGDRVVGTALPPLPTFGARTCPPPIRTSLNGQDYQRRH